MSGKAEDLAGRRFGRLIAVERCYGLDSKKTYWRCICDCGNEAIIRADRLKGSHARSCGCLLREVRSSSAKEKFQKCNTKHGWAKKGGEKRLYRIWVSMKSRCNDTKNKDYPRYGGRGISVSDEWSDFETFKCWALENGYSDDLTIDRIDNDGWYGPENCRWTTPRVQANNRRGNRVIECMGERKTMSEWAEKYKIDPRYIWQRMVKYGWDAERAITTPVRKG